MGTREELDDLQKAWLAADDTSMDYRDAREDYLLALADAYEGGELITRAEAEAAVREEREACAHLVEEWDKWKPMVEVIAATIRARSTPTTGETP